MDLWAALEAPPMPALWLSFAGVAIRVEAGEPEVLRRLAAYYEPYVTEPVSPAAAEVRLIHGPASPTDGFADVPRGGARRVKEAVREVPGWRLIWKRLTGVTMAIQPGRAVACGPLLANLNQVINLVNAVYARAVVARGYLLVHASAVSWGCRAVALGGPSGAGKSTAALRLVEHGFRFLSNDRVMVRADGEGVHALGYPKQPRVNPGTLLGHPRLRGLLPPGDAEALAAMAPLDLWGLERKSDVDLDAIYGKGTVELSARLEALVLVRWRPDGHGFAARRLTTDEALGHLPLFYKDLGVFDVDRPAWEERSAERQAEYRSVLGRLALVEVTGRPDFEALVGVVRDALDRVSAAHP